MWNLLLYYVKKNKHNRKFKKKIFNLLFNDTMIFIFTIFNRLKCSLMEIYKGNFIKICLPYVTGYEFESPPI